MCCLMLFDRCMALVLLLSLLLNEASAHSLGESFRPDKVISSTNTTLLDHLTFNVNKSKYKHILVDRFFLYCVWTFIIIQIEVEGTVVGGVAIFNLEPSCFVSEELNVTTKDLKLYTDHNEFIHVSWLMFREASS